MPGWVGPAALALLAVVINIVPFGAARTASHDMAGALAFLLLAVPLAVVLDETGFFSALAAMAGGGRHLRSGLWGLAAVVTIVFNLDAAVVLLTPLYVRIAERRRRGPDRVRLHPCIAGVTCVVGAAGVQPHQPDRRRATRHRCVLLRRAPRPPIGGRNRGRRVGLRATLVGTARTAERLVSEVANSTATRLRAALRIGIPVVVWLLLGFTIGERVGIPAWVIAGVALAALMIQRRCLPWRHIPFGAALLAGGLGVLAAAAAPHLPVDRVLSIRGLPGELATSHLPPSARTRSTTFRRCSSRLPDLTHHQDRVWAVLLGTNLGPTLWVTGALSTLLWQSTMHRLGHRVLGADIREHCGTGGHPGDGPLQSQCT